MARKRKPAEAVNTNEWMNTYADTVTLLLCFFVLLFSFSTVNENKWKSIVESFSGEFAGGSAVNGTSPEVSETTDELLYRTIKNYIETNDLTAKVDLMKDNEIVTIRFKDTILFDPDKTELRADGKVILGDITNALKTNINMIEIIRIEGHTASNPKGLPEFENTFEFSTKRAVNVLDFMMNEKKIQPLKLSAVGYGQYHPISTNETAEGRSQNRRVEIIVRSRNAKTE